MEKVSVYEQVQNVLEILEEHRYKATKERDKPGNVPNVISYGLGLTDGYFVAIDLLEKIKQEQDQ